MVRWVGIAITAAAAASMLLADAVLDLPQVGGLAGLRSALPEWAFRFTPSVGGDGLNAGGAFALTVSAFLAFVGVQWWSSWYPGSEPGGRRVQPGLGEPPQVALGAADRAVLLQQRANGR